jgi:virulence-associated protein VagC
MHIEKSAGGRITLPEYILEKLPYRKHFEVNVKGSSLVLHPIRKEEPAAAALRGVIEMFDERFGKPAGEVREQVVKTNAKNQIKLPAALNEYHADVTMFDVTMDGRDIVLTPLLEGGRG